MIQKITATNLNGLSFEHTLGKVNVVTGDNFEGKTTLLNAVRLAMLGHIPRLGKQAGATMKLCPELESEMTVAAEFADRLILQKWTRNKKGCSLDREGDLLAIPPVLCDLNEFLSKTSAERIKFVFDKIDVDKLGFADDDVIKRLSVIETTPAAISTVAVEVMLAYAHASIVERDKFKFTRQQWLEKLIAGFKKEMGNYKSTAEYNSSQQLALHKQMPAKTPPNVQADLEKLTKQLEDLKDRKRSLTEAFTRWQQTETRRAELKVILEHPVAEPVELRQKMETITTQIGREEANLKEHEANLHRLRERRRNYTSNQTGLTQEINALKDKITSFATASCCPTCKSKRKGWQEEVQAELEAQIKLKEGELGRVADAIVEIDRDGLKSKEAAADLTNTINQLRAEASRLSEEYGRQLLAAAGYAGALKEQETLNLANPKPDLADLPAVDEQIVVLQKEMETVRLGDSMFKAFATLKARKDEVEAESIKASVHQRIFKMAIDEVLKIQSEMISTAIGGVLAVAQPMVEGILRAPLEFRGGELGYTLNGGWVSYETFSGTEEAVSFAAFALALSQESPYKVVLIDELDRIKGPRRLKFLQRMIELTDAGVIDQFFGAGVESEIYSQVPGLTVIKLG